MDLIDPVHTCCSQAFLLERSGTVRKDMREPDCGLGWQITGADYGPVVQMALYGVIGDIHGNLEALTATFLQLERHRPAQLLCVGDVVGYNADPDNCAALLRDRCVKAIAGNHDLIGIRRLGIERCSTNAMHALRRTRRSLHPRTAEYLCALPTTLEIEDRVVLVRGVACAYQLLTGKTLGRSLTAEGTPTGPGLRLVRLCLAPLDALVTDDAIVWAIRRAQARP